MMLASTLINPECLELVSGEWEKLQDAIGELGSAVNGTLGRQKEDLVRTHAMEMRKAQVDLEALSKEKIRLEESIASNERACQLEIERDWYKKEALHLDDELEKMKTKQKELNDRLEESEQERKWLKGQVERLTNHNQSLEAKFKELGIETAPADEVAPTEGLGELHIASEESHDAKTTVDFVTENADAEDVQTSE